MDLWCCFGDSNPANHLAGWYAIDVAVAGDYAYLACGNAGLLVVDVSDPEHPRDVGRCKAPGSAHGVAVAGGYAYVADLDSGLHIINISDPQNPYETGCCATAGFGWDVAVAGSYAYVADFGYRRLHVIDVANPQNPHQTGYCSTVGTATGVAIVGTYAYVTASDSGLRVIDISNPQSPFETGHHDTPARATGVEFVGSYAYVADDTSGLRIVDVSNPQNPSEVGHCDTPGNAMGVAVVGTCAYVADGGSGLRVINVSDPQNPHEAGYCDTPGSAVNVTSVGGHAYVADGGSGLRVINVADPQSPYEVGSLSNPARPLGADVYLTAYGFTDSVACDLFILKYELANRSGSLLSQVYFGLSLDGDVGDGTDDMAGLILDKLFRNGSDTFRVRNAGYIYDYNNSENPGQSWESGTPGAVAVRLLAAPHGLGLTALKKYTIDTDPVMDVDQYLTLAGYDYRTGEYHPFDSVDLSAADKRVLLSSGPFDLPADSTVVFYYAVVGAKYGEPNQTPPNRDSTDLALRCWWAESVFQRVIGIEETPNAEVRKPNRGATIIRGVLVLGRVASRQNTAYRAELLDINGRKVLDLRPGANDVRSLAPGVYFVIEYSVVSSQYSGPPAVTKVILTE